MGFKVDIADGRGGGAAGGWDGGEGNIFPLWAIGVGAGGVGI